MTTVVSRPLAVAASIAILTAGVLAAPAPASAHWSCGRAAPPDADTTGNHSALYPAVARVGSSARCAEQSDNFANLSLDYHCWAADINGRDTWTYVIVVGLTNKRGWVNDHGLRDHGSRVRCAGDN